MAAAQTLMRSLFGQGPAWLVGVADDAEADGEAEGAAPAEAKEAECAWGGSLAVGLGPRPAYLTIKVRISIRGGSGRCCAGCGRNNLSGLVVRFFFTYRLVFYICTYRLIFYISSLPKRRATNP